jgi:hypothetical protein
MPVAVLVEVEGTGIETYDATNALLGGLAENPPDGLLAHMAAASESGGYFVFNVFESVAAWESFRDGRRAAALSETMPAGLAPPKATIWELHTFSTF